MCKAIGSVARSVKASPVQAGCTRAVVGEIGEVSKGSGHRVPFSPCLGVCNACGRHDFTHTINGKVV